MDEYNVLRERDRQGKAVGREARQDQGPLRCSRGKVPRPRITVAVLSFV
jgi:hypothetical protein